MGWTCSQRFQNPTRRRVYGLAKHTAFGFHAVPKRIETGPWSQSCITSPGWRAVPAASELLSAPCTGLLRLVLLPLACWMLMPLRSRLAVLARRANRQLQLPWPVVVTVYVCQSSMNDVFKRAGSWERKCHVSRVSGRACCDCLDTLACEWPWPAAGLHDCHTLVGHGHSFRSRPRGAQWTLLQWLPPFQHRQLVSGHHCIEVDLVAVACKSTVDPASLHLHGFPSQASLWGHLSCVQRMNRSP